MADSEKKGPSKQKRKQLASGSVRLRPDWNICTETWKIHNISKHLHRIGFEQLHTIYYIASIVHCIQVQPPHWQGLGLQVSSSWTCYIWIVYGIDQQTMGLRTTSCHLSVATIYHSAIQPRISGVTCYQQLAHMRTISLMSQIDISIIISVCTDHNR